MTSVAEFAATYDQFMLDTRMEKVYGHSGFFNVGYWPAGTQDQQSACENLVERLTAALGPDPARVLDVACGCGATTAWIKARHTEAEVTGINISRQQLRQSMEREPRCLFLLMDAAQMGFPDNWFDSVVCVEAAFHFHTRERFLHETLRILRPGGSLVLSDVLFADTRYVGEWMVPPENAVSGIDSYRNLLKEAGFEHIDLVDATAECWKPFCLQRMQAIESQFISGEISEGPFKRQMEYWDASLNKSVSSYLIVSARKP